MLDLDFVRSRFPALDSGWAYLDNGGGSQIVQPVLDRLHEFLVGSFVQVGATYVPSTLATERLERAHRAVATLVNAREPDEVVMGPSTTALFGTLARSLAETIEPGDEIVVTRGDHEANIAPWLTLERAGAIVRWWEIDPAGELSLEALDAVLGPKTRLVSVTHASNILGTINPIRAIPDRVHAAGAWLCVDGVGFAPHRAVDVQELDVDFYAFSFYKTFGPHHAVLFGRKEHLLRLPGQSFGFIEEDDVPYKFQPGNVNYELSYAVLGITDYLQEVADGLGRTAETVGPDSGRRGDDAHAGREVRTAVESAFGAIADHEERLCDRLLGFLRARPRVRILGSPEADREIRVPIVSFVTPDVASRTIVEAVDDHRVGIRFGDFYSRRLVDALDLPDEDGVVRVSMVHYNTLTEMDRLIEALDAAL